MNPSSFRGLLSKVPVFTFGALIACSGEVPPAPDASAPPSLAPIATDQLGGPCTTVGDTCASCASTTLTEVCQGQYCAAGASSLVGYCSAGCDDRACPAGYECKPAKVLATAGAAERVAKSLCFRSSPAAPAPSSVCGNGKVEAGEACDDGNSESTDACTADCKTGHPPRVKLELTWGQHFSPSQPLPYTKKVDTLLGKASVDECDTVRATRHDIAMKGSVFLQFVLCDSEKTKKLYAQVLIPPAGSRQLSLPSQFDLSVDGYRYELVGHDFLPSGVRPSVIKVDAAVQGGKGIRGTIVVDSWNVVGGARTGGNFASVNGTFEVVPTEEQFR